MREQASADHNLADCAEGAGDKNALAGKTIVSEG